MAKYRFKNLQQLNNYLEDRTQKALNKVAIIAMEKLKENVNNSVYGWTPKKYIRTGMLLNAISKTEATKTLSGRYTVEIYFDYLKLQPVINEYGWNSHADFWGGWISNDQSSSDIVNWLENGTNNKYFSHPAYGFIKDTIVELKAEYANIFREKLKESM